MGNEDSTDELRRYVERLRRGLDDDPAVVVLPTEPIRPFVAGVCDPTLGWLPHATSTASPDLTLLLSDPGLSIRTR